MTLVIGMILNNVAWLAADRGAYDTEVHDYCVLAHSKIVHVQDDILVGVSGSVRLIQHIQFTKFPVCAPTRDPLEWVVRVLVPLLQDKLKADGVEHGLGNASLLIATRGRLFEVEDEWGVVESNLRYGAIGSGRFAACGAMGALRKQLHAAIDPTTFAHDVFNVVRQHVHTVHACADVVAANAG